MSAEEAMSSYLSGEKQGKAGITLPSVGSNVEKLVYKEGKFLAIKGSMPSWAKGKEALKAFIYV
jgi:hypothetical protein